MPQKSTEVPCLENNYENITVHIQCCSMRNMYLYSYSMLNLSYKFIFLSISNFYCEQDSLLWTGFYLDLLGSFVMTANLSEILRGWELGLKAFPKQHSIFSTLSITNLCEIIWLHASIDTLTVATPSLFLFVSIISHNRHLYHFQQSVHWIIQSRRKILFLWKTLWLSGEPVI